MNRFGKALAAALIAVITAVQALVSDDVVTRAEWIQIAIAVVTAVSVYLVTIWEYAWMKTAIGPAGRVERPRHVDRRRGVVG